MAGGKRGLEAEEPNELKCVLLQKDEALGVLP